MCISIFLRAAHGFDNNAGSLLCRSLNLRPCKAYFASVYIYIYIHIYIYVFACINVYISEQVAKGFALIVSNVCISVFPFVGGV